MVGEAAVDGVSGHRASFIVTGQTFTTAVKIIAIRAKAGRNNTVSLDV